MERDVQLQFDHLNNKVDRVIRILDGNGQVGVTTRVDRLEQRWRLGAMLCMGVGSFVTVVLERIFGLIN
jgi:hypothetical protein